MTLVTWTETAIDDLQAHAAYIAQFNPYAASRIVRHLFTAGNSLATFPKSGKARSDGTRELAVVHPYILVYDIVEDEVRILRVWHGAQDRG
ncbi:hypothetical protein IP70_00605 [alpha proteobacterium AAP38]|nr:hypothetical protein IP70_00605 [alpha proteobacterium AAP38]